MERAAEDRQGVATVSGANLSADAIRQYGQARIDFQFSRGENAKRGLLKQAASVFRREAKRCLVRRLPVHNQPGDTTWISWMRVRFSN